MADMSWHSQGEPRQGSAVLDMEMDDEEMQHVGSSQNSDSSDYGHTGPKPGSAGQEKGNFSEDLKQRMTENVTQMMWQAGTQNAKRVWSLYGNIDILRPYFDVEPKEVQKRLFYSLIPMRPTDERQRVPKELYGPTMVVLTLIALLLYQMKSADHRVEEGTLMGSAFGVCFMYWIGASCLVWFVTYLCNIRIVLLQVLSMMGYSLFGHCIVLFLGTVVHTSHDHMLFYFLWAVIGGLSSLRMAGIIMSRTRGRTERMLVIGSITALHLLFLLYLHFAYHNIVEELSHALNDKLVPVPVAMETAEKVEMPAQQEDVEKVGGLDLHADSSLSKQEASAGVATPVITLAKNVTAGLGQLLVDSQQASQQDSVLLGKLRQGVGA